MRGILVDVQNGALLDMLEDNRKETMIEAIKSLHNWDKNIRVVTTDMANNYLRWLPDLLPNATIVIDKFHVIKDIQSKISSAKNVLYEYRKNAIKKLENPEERIRQTAILNIVNDKRRLFNYSMESIFRDEKDRALKLDTVMSTFPEFKALRMMYFYIEDMYMKETWEEAEKAWDEWQFILPPEVQRRNTKTGVICIA